jgi:hypothetical protein
MTFLYHWILKEAIYINDNMKIDEHRNQINLLDYLYCLLLIIAKVRLSTVCNEK